MSGPANGGRARGYQALRESEELHRATLGSISDAVFLTDDDGTFTYICPNVDVIFGYVPDEVQSMGKIGRLLGEGLFDATTLASKGEIRNVERDVVSKSGERRTVLVHLKRVSIQGGTVLYTCRDVSELRAAERELTATRLDLTHAARLALVGQLTASIMHEVQQPLTSIGIHAGSALRLLDGDRGKAGLDDIQTICGEISQASAAAIEIIDRLKSLVRKRPLDLVPLDLNAVVNDVLVIVGPDAVRRGVVLDAELAPGLPEVAADRVSLQHVILDLIVNAMDAMDESEGQRAVTVRTQADADGVTVTVSDTGPGIAAEHKDRLFDAFFTTKAQGIGLGLAIARSIVEAHAGRIGAEDHGGPGATFRLVLPVRARDAAP